MADLTSGIYLRMSPADLARWHEAAAEANRSHLKTKGDGD